MYRFMLYTIQSSFSCSSSSCNVRYELQLSHYTSCPLKTGTDLGVNDPWMDTAGSTGTGVSAGKDGAGWGSFDTSDSEGSLLTASILHSSPGASNLNRAAAHVLFGAVCCVTITIPLSEKSCRERTCKNKNVLKP